MSEVLVAFAIPTGIAVAILVLTFMGRDDPPEWRATPEQRATMRDREIARLERGLGLVECPPPPPHGPGGGSR